MIDTVADHHRPGGGLHQWSVMLKALPIPAALVDPDGVVLAANRWIDAVAGQPLLQPSTEDVAPGLRFGIDSSSRWRVRALDDEGAVMLATGEREDVGDHLLRRFFSSGDSLFVVYDQWGRVIESNAAWENLLGYTHDEVFGTDSWTLLPPDDQSTRAAVEEALRAHGKAEPQFKMRTADGTYRDIRWTLAFDTSVGRCFGIGRDVTEEDRRAAELQRRAYTDELTGLANRARFLEELDRCLADTRTPAVLFCDLDRFKVVNDSLGHQAGDELLAQLGRRLADATGDEGLMARLGGDEFVGLLPDADRAEAVTAATGLLTALHEPFNVAGRAIHVTMSVGIALADGPTATDAERLLGHADTAAYEAKKLGRKRFVIFDDDLRATVDRRFNVEAGLRQALQADDQLVPHYQPIVSLPGGGVIGAEALIRWNLPNGEVIPPGAFLDVAEEAGLMPDLGDRVMCDALRLGAELAEAGRPLFMSVNVAPAELAQHGFADRLLTRIDESGLDPTLLLIEITESAVINTDSTVPVLHELRSHGIRVGLDDFGTGFSSLAHLRQLPIDVVKVDRLFVFGGADDLVSRAVTSSLVGLCQALELDVVIEGIETVDHAALADQLGVKMGQGFLHHRPMPADHLRNLLGRGRDDSWRKRAASSSPSTPRAVARPPGAVSGVGRASDAGRSGG
ncbi:MAG: EAL domain-containing protein [Actinomycetota bacterium]